MNKFAWEKEDIYFLGGLEKFLLSIPGSSILEIKQSPTFVLVCGKIYPKIFAYILNVIYVLDE